MGLCVDCGESRTPPQWAHTMADCVQLYTLHACTTHARARQVIQTKGRCDSKKNQIFRAAEILALESERKAHVKECGSLASGCP